MRFTAIRMLARDWRGGELGVLLAALVIAVAIVSAISAFTSRLQNALEQESHRFLAADQVLSSLHDPGEKWLDQATGLGLNTARTLSFPSMVYAGEEDLYLAAVKAVSDNYPLLGEIIMSKQAFGELQNAKRGPSRGEVWLDSRLFPLLNVEIGQSMTIGRADFRISGAVRSEPDQSASVFGFGPRVLMHYSDIEATDVVQPGSRVEYRQLFAGEASKLTQLSAAMASQLKSGERIIDVGNSQQSIGRALQRAEQFLLLAGSLGVVLAGVAIALAARRFSERHYDYVAIMKSLGSTSGAINRLYGSSLILLGVAATALGCFLGWSMQAVFFRLFAEALPITPAVSGLRSYAIGGVTALVCLASFAWPPLYRLSQASPLRVLRRDMPNESRQTAIDWVFGLAAIVLLMLWYSGDWKLTAGVLAGLLASASLASVAALMLLRGGRLAGMRAGSVWRLAFAGLQRRGGANTLQVVIFSMSIMLLLILILVRTSLIEEWQMQLPEGTPNHFLVNIAPYEVNQVREALSQKALLSQPLYPMIRGRLTHLNEEALGRSDDPDIGRRERELNMSWSAQLPQGNTVASGEWWEPNTELPLVSIEEGMAERMQLQVGDRLRYLIGSQVLEVTIASTRRLDWESMRPNFWMVFPPAVLQGYPATFMTSFHLEASEKPFLNDFIRQFPTVSVVEMDVVIKQVRGIIDQVSAAIELVLAAILAAGGLVLIAGVQASVDSRLYESAVLRALGARKSLLLGSLVIEFSALGLFAGVLATVAAELSVYILQTQVLNMDYVAHPLLWFIGPLVGVVLIGALGVWNCRHVVSSPPVVVLREL